MQRLTTMACGLLMCAATVWPQNLLCNPGFEQLDVGAARDWRVGGKAGVATDGGVAHSGQRCVKARFDDGVSQQVRIKGGAAYRISGWIRRVEPGGSETPKIKVYFLDAKGGRADVQATAFRDVPADRWLRWETVMQAPFNAGTLNLTLRGLFGGSEWFYYDDLTIERIEAPTWPGLDSTPNLHGQTVVVPDIADVWTDALLRIPPASLVPVDGKLDSSVLTRGEDIRVLLQRPTRVNWALVHTMRPQMNLGAARLVAIDGQQQRLLAESAASKALVTSLRFQPRTVREFVLDVPSDAEIHVNEIQLLGLNRSVALPGDRVDMAVAPGAPPASVAGDLPLAFAAEEHRASLVAAPSATGAGTVPLPAERYVNVFATPRPDAYGIAGVSLRLALPGAKEGDIVEVTLKRPAELDTNIRYTTYSDRGLAATGKRKVNRRDYATVFRVVSRIGKTVLAVSFDVPDLVYAKGEPVWLTLRARRDMTLGLARSRVALHVVPAQQAYREYLPQLERLMRRMYSDASEAHAYDSRPWSRMILGRYVRRVLEIDPDNKPAMYVYRRIAKVREEVQLTRPGPADAPDWAVWARQALRNRHEIIMWWLDHRQQANGELAGHINDDGEFSCNWPSHYFMVGEERIADGLRKLAQVAWEMSAGTGYTVGSRDVEHAAEDQSCTQPQVLLVDYGNPKAVERFMVMSRYLGFWTAINEVGRRQFKSYMFTTKRIWDDPPYDIDQPYCPLSMVGTGHLIWYTHSPKVTEIFLQEAESWALACLSTDGGKPAGRIPKEIRGRDSKIDPYAPYPGNPILQKRSTLYRNGAGAYIVRYFLQGAFALTNADPFRRVVQLWQPLDEERIERARQMLERFNERIVPPPSGPEKRFAVVASKPNAVEAPMRPVRAGQAIGTTTQDEGGWATYTVDVREPGRYAVWGLLGRSDGNENDVLPKTFFVTVDDRPRDRMRTHAPAQEWTPTVSASTYQLEAGKHTIKIAARTPGSALKEIGFTDHYTVEGMWRAGQNETGLYQAWRATGDSKWLVEELKEVVRQQIRNRWLLTEAEPYTDRVPMPGRDLLSRVFLGDWTSGKSHVPGHWVSWEGGGLDYAALVLDAKPDHLKALVHSFHARPQPMTLRVWRLPHGRYDVSIGLDQDGDGKPEKQLRGEQMELWRYDGAVRFTAQPGQTLVIELSLRQKLDDVRMRPDLAIGPGDVAVEDRGVVVTVHNIGGSASPASTVQVQAADGTELGAAQIPALDPPHDLQPKIARVRIEFRQGATPSWVALDPADEVAEITEANNRLRLR